MKKLIFMLLTTLFMVSNACAQTYAQEELAKQRAAERVAQMNDYVSFMASKQKNPNYRRYYRNKALNLFIGKGYDYNRDGYPCKGVIMEVSSTQRRTVSKPLIRDYFTNLINLRYTTVKITSSEVAEMKVSNLKKTEDDNVYECTCQYVQIFEGRNDRFVYKDKVVKRVKCYVTFESVEDEENPEMMVLLGDTQCISTEKL